MILQNICVAKKVINPIWVVLPAFLMIIPVTMANPLGPVFQFCGIVGLASFCLVFTFKQAYTSGNYILLLDEKGYPELSPEERKLIEKGHLYRFSAYIAKSEHNYRQTGSKDELRETQKAFDVYYLAGQLPEYDEAKLLPEWDNKKPGESLLKLFEHLAMKHLEPSRLEEKSTDP